MRTTAVTRIYTRVQAFIYASSSPSAKGYPRDIDTPDIVLKYNARKAFRSQTQSPNDIRFNRPARQDCNLYIPLIASRGKGGTE